MHKRANFVEVKPESIAKRFKTAGACKSFPAVILLIFLILI